MSQADAGYPVAESSGEKALRACIVWCPGWVGVWGVRSLVEILQVVLLDVRTYCWFCWSYWLSCVLNEWEDIVEYSIDLEVRGVSLIRRPGSGVVACSCFPVVDLGSVPGQ